MKRFLIAAAFSVTAISTPVHAADAGVPVGSGQPGFYDLLDIGIFPPPQVIYLRPKTVNREVSDHHHPPLNQHVPVEHARHLSKKCREYNASDEHRNDQRGNQSNAYQVDNHDQVRDHRDHRCV